jgi:hypothetical protein
MTYLVVKTAVGQDFLRVLWLFLFIIIIIIPTMFNISGGSWDLWQGWGYDYFVISERA